MKIVDVIKYEGDNRTFISKHPAEDFNTSTQLIVHESQCAIFFYNGQALDSFGPGRHVLETQNIPLLTALTSKVATDGDSPFHAEVYFINLVEQMGIPWGTNSKIQYMDPEFNFPLSVGASGEMALAVSNPRKLLIKLVGTEALLSQDRLIGYFKSFLQTRIKSAIANAIVEQHLNIFQMDACLEPLSEIIKSKLASDFSVYGIELSQFLVTNILKPEGEPVYEKFKELYFRQFADVREAEIAQQTAVINAETLAKQKVIDAHAQAEKRRSEGYTYQQERGYDVAEKVAANEAVGEFSNLGIGMGMISGVSGPVASMVGTAISDTMVPTTLAATFAPKAPIAETPDQVQETDLGLSKYCVGCGYQFPNPSMKFCPQCGTKRQ
ncbi:MAG: SPFH domain-containing protein [Coriobacteriaceae bacterium]|nr:SPFH domain-containing protein [Coriobacteriaceae bacterium]